ncbi:isoprenylcysteine carboxylmethyltransferase family protein [Labrys portucalensis]|uniref:Isoprenylcysteine carboxylmethyltransferase family protein n=1 Tax=Labrys neptuniae TaxID=376174 RepID=A0ABV6ZD07_9HYPH
MLLALMLPALWIAWAVSWFAASGWASAPSRVESGRSALPYRFYLAVGAILLILPNRFDWAPRLWHPTAWESWTIDLLALAGFVFCWWARLHLGRLWSSAVTIKPEHRIVDSGPYGLVRHPIYTGLLLAVFASVLANGTWLGMVGGLIMLAGFLSKARLEETALREALGREAYDDYASRVPMLVPLLPHLPG